MAIFQDLIWEQDPGRVEYSDKTDIVPDAQRTRRALGSSVDSIRSGTQSAQQSLARVRRL